MSFCTSHGGSDFSRNCPICIQEKANKMQEEHNTEIQNQARRQNQLLANQNEMIERQHREDRYRAERAEREKFEREQQEIDDQNGAIEAKSARKFPKIFKEKSEKYGVSVFAKNYLRLELSIRRLYTEKDFIGSLIRSEYLDKMTTSDKESVLMQQKILDIISNDFPEYFEKIKNRKDQISQKFTKIPSQFGIFSTLSIVLSLVVISSLDWLFFFKLIASPFIILVLLIVGLFIDSFNVKSKKKQLDEQNKKLENAVENLQQEINNLFEDLYDNETATGLKNLDIKKQGFESFDEALDYALEKWSKEDFADRYSIFKTALDNYEKFKNSFDEKVSNQLNLA